MFLLRGDKCSEPVANRDDTKKGTEHHKTDSDDNVSLGNVMMEMDMYRATSLVRECFQETQLFANTSETANAVAALRRFHSSEIRLGKMVGRGQFNAVHDIRIVPAQSTEVAGTSPSCDSDDDDDCHSSQSSLASSAFSASSSRSFRRRLVVKRMRKDLPDKLRAHAMADLVREVYFLSALCHENIVDLEGTGGMPCHPTFFVVQHRMPLTLDVQLKRWSQEGKRLQGSFLGWVGRNDERLKQLRHVRLSVACQIADALRYMHSRNVLHRDIKAENIGFADSHGDDAHPDGDASSFVASGMTTPPRVQLFDFGLARELKPSERSDNDCHSYHLTGRIGPMRYMAPEVIESLPYGRPAECFSFAILLWEILTLQRYNVGHDVEKHAKAVVEQKKRPPLAWGDESNGDAVICCMKQSWLAHPHGRPSMKEMYHCLSGVCDSQ